MNEPFWFLGRLFVSKQDRVAFSVEVRFRGVEVPVALGRAHGKVPGVGPGYDAEAAWVIQYAREKFAEAGQCLVQGSQAELLAGCNEIPGLWSIRRRRVGDIHGGQEGPVPD